MKVSSYLPSVLFGSLALAAPVDRRALVTETVIVTEEVVVYTTVWDGQAEATTTPGLFYEQPAKPTTSSSSSSSTSVYTPPAKPSTTSTSTTPPPPPPAPTTTSTPAPVYTPSSQEAPKPEPTTSAPPPPPPAPSSSAPAPAPEPVTSYAPAPVSSSAPAAPAPSSPSSGGSGNSYTGEVTVYDTQGGKGACGDDLNDDMMIAAVAKGLWGVSSTDYMTGESTNPWCKKTATVHYKGNSVTVKIVDMCPGCGGNDLDLSRKAWNQLTGGEEAGRLTDIEWSA